MKLKIIGRPIGSGVDQSILRNAANFIVNILMKHDAPRMDEISVELNLIPNMVEDLKNAGCCGWLDHRQRPDKFFVDLDSALTQRTSLISLAHELVHVKQMAMGERSEGIDGLIRWFGVPHDITTIHYYDLPWEIEAHGREYGLYDRFIQSINNQELEPAKIIDVSNRLKVA